jgi:hypothetical protein
MPPKGAGRNTAVGRPLPPQKGYAQQIYQEITSPENRSVVTSLAFFAVSPHSSRRCSKTLLISICRPVLLFYQAVGARSSYLRMNLHSPTLPNPLIGTQNLIIDRPVSRWQKTSDPLCKTSCIYKHSVALRWTKFEQRNERNTQFNSPNLQLWSSHRYTPDTYISCALASVMHVT